MKHRSSMPKRPSSSIRKAARKKRPAAELKQGQQWKMEGRRMEIMLVGKHLAHYRLYQQHKRVPTSLAAISKIQSYLKANGARLVRSDHLAKECRVAGRGIQFAKA
jgi:hypothetical protein